MFQTWPPISAMAMPALKVSSASIETRKDFPLGTRQRWPGRLSPGTGSLCRSPQQHSFAEWAQARNPRPVYPNLGGTQSPLIRPVASQLLLDSCREVLFCRNRMLAISQLSSLLPVTSAPLRGLASLNERLGQRSTELR